MRRPSSRRLKRISPHTNGYYVRAAVNGRRQNIGIVRYRSTDKWDAETVDGDPLGTATTDQQAAEMVEERSANETHPDRSIERLRWLVSHAHERREQRISLDLQTARAILDALDHGDERT